MVVEGHPVRGTAAPGDVIVHASVLGRFEVRIGDRRVERSDWQRLSAERLVKLLLVTRGHALPREAATEALWPDADPGAGGASFRKALHYAHRALDGTGVLAGEGRTVSLDATRLDLDLDRLLDAFAVLEGARTGAGADDATASAIDTVLELGADDLLPDDPYEDWLVGPRERLRSRWQAVALAAATRARDHGDTVRAIAIADRLLEHDPTDEAAHRLAIELYARDGRHHAARRQFELCRDALARELDAEPSAETRAVFEEAQKAARAAPTVPRPPRLVARRAELERIEPLLDRLAAGRSAGLVLRGPAGIGKTRLLQEVAGYASAAGWRVAWWQATDATRELTHGQTRAALATLAPASRWETWEEPGRSAAGALLPAVDRPSLLPFEAPAALLAGLLSAFDSAARDGPAMLAVDDLPSLDDASRDVLAAILGALPDRPLLIAATCRDGEAWSTGTAAFVDEVRRFGGLDLAVGPLGPRDIEPLIVTHLGGSSVHGDVAAAAFAASAGNPLFCLEIVQAARDGGMLRLESDRWSPVAGVPPMAIPPTVQGLVAARSSSLSPATLELLAVAAELGGACTYRALAAVIPVSEGELVGDIDAALASGLLVEQGAVYGFAHPLYRRAVIERARPTRRAERRLAIARALAGNGAATADPTALCELAARHPDPFPVADHALAAASDGRADAAPLGVAFGFAAGERLVRMFDRDAARAILQRSLQAWHRLEPQLAAGFDASRGWRVLGDLELAAGDQGAAVVAYRESERVARDASELATAYASHSHMPYRHGDFDATLAILDEAERRLPADAEVARARIRTETAWCLARLRRFAEALPLAESALGTLLANGDMPGSMRALDVFGMVLTYVGRRDEGIGRIEQALALALELQDPMWEVRARLHVGLLLVRSGQPARARPHFERGTELAALRGDLYGQATSEWGAAEMEHRLGDLAAAAAHRRREIELLQTLGGNPHNEAMSHAHLAHLARTMGEAADATAEAAAARRLALLSPEAGYAARIETALSVDDWGSLES